MLAHLKHQRHSNLCMELDMTMEQPVPGIVGHESNNRVTTVGHRDRVLLWGSEQSPLKLSLLVQLLDRLQIHARVQPFHADDAESVAVQVKGMVRIVRVSWRSSRRGLR